MTSIFFLWKLVRWWRHRLDRFIFQYFLSPAFKECPFTLQTPKCSFIRMPVNKDGLLIWNWWVCWSEDQSQLHINMFEIMAIRFALIKAIKYIHHSCVMISTDNTTVVSYINKQGGTHSPNLCIEVWNIILSSGFLISQANSMFWQTGYWESTK